ncbi:ABC transporter substrate-binding protein [Curtobacterium sp. MCPF17_052]|uniref:ABC transporter substrate-binding protein n=1 Tax=Curtobacterium sp. MCPF17_052 TaxID=2175655 RepID=UPI0024DF92C9|nr:ABC transporter substrate-binding protein [Curtobacterium sp. MCPF17_052]WIB13590.1 ABC transporter substrate-binding protein [Curtobacterium sp. MCPF17_052]
MTHQAVEDSQDARGPRQPLVIVALAVLVIAVVLAVVVFVIDRNTPAAEAVPATVPVPIRVAHVPDGTKIGVVVTLGYGEGSEWDEAAQGALVAAKRLTLGGTDVELVTRNDGGSASGAKRAVEQLVDSGVAGIVVASSGAHVSGALDAASDAGVPVVLPYADGGDGSWSTAPSRASVSAAMQRAIRGADSPAARGPGRRCSVRYPVRPRDGRRRRGRRRCARDDRSPADRCCPDDHRNVGCARRHDGHRGHEARLRCGRGERSGGTAGGRSSRRCSPRTSPSRSCSPPDATSPAFGTALAAANGSLSGTFVSTGVATDDARALTSDAQGRSMSAFLGGVRVLSDDAEAQNLTADQPFSAVAWAADSRSHDAVVALVRAVGAARSDEPSAVADALSTLRLDASDGLAGPALDFRQQQALRADATVLAASSQTLGLRPATTEQTASLVWFQDSTAR